MSSLQQNSTEAELLELLNDQKSRNKALVAINQELREKMARLRNRNEYLEEDVGEVNRDLEARLSAAAGRCLEMQKQCLEAAGAIYSLEKAKERIIGLESKLIHYELEIERLTRRFGLSEKERDALLGKEEMGTGNAEELLTTSESPAL